MDCRPPGSSVHGISQARILEWVATSSSRGSSRPRNRTWLSCTAGRFFTVWATKESHISQYYRINHISLWYYDIKKESLLSSFCRLLKAVVEIKYLFLFYHFLSLEQFSFLCLISGSYRSVATWCPAPHDPKDCSPPGYMEFSREEYWSGLPLLVSTIS